MSSVFILKCKSCNWFRKSGGLSSDLRDLTEVSNCAKCSGRKYKCPKCGTIMKLIRVKTNDSN
jgi:hypothetical protein